MRRVRWQFVALGVVAGTALVAQLSPLLAWHAGVARLLSEKTAAHRLRSPIANVFPAVPAAWQLQQVGELTLALPPGGRLARGCAIPAEGCFIEWEEASLSVLPSGEIEPYEEMLDFRAPDERDLSIWRSARANWETVGALWTFVTTSRSKLDSYRFAQARAKGVVVHSMRDGRSRWVVSAYAPDESAARGFAAAGFSDEEFQTLLGGVDLESAGVGAVGPVR
jgi:hypothetical protein